MIPYFPSIYPDELLYSQLARYYAKSGYLAYTFAAEDLFQSKTIRPDIEFLNAYTPEALHMITRKMPMEDIVKNHTMFPYYGRFIPPERRRQAFDSLVNMGTEYHNLLSIPKRKDRVSRHLRYCPECVKDDRQKYGETYWHRIHQMVGVNICPVHHCHLIDSDIVTSSNVSPALITAEEIVEIPEKITYSDNDLECRLAEYVAEVYERYISDQKKLLDDLYTEYEALLNQRLENTDALLEEMIGSVNSNTDSINSTLTDAADSVGYTMSESMQSIWNGSTEALDGTLSVYGDGFSEKLTAINNVLNQIQANIVTMISTSDEVAEEDISTTTSKTEPTPASGSPETTPTGPEVSTPVEPAEKEITIGGKINAEGAKIYDYAGDKSGENQYFAKDPIYTVLGESNGYLKVRYHKLSSGVTGWFKKSDVEAFKTGGLVDYTGLAQLDGTPSKPELVLNAQDTENFLALKDTLRKLANQEITLQSGVSGYESLTPVAHTGYFDNAQAIKHILRQNPVNNIQPSMGDINVDVSIDHVQDYNDFAYKLIHDNEFEKAIQAMTVDRLVGGSPLDKHRYASQIQRRNQ